ncbi:MAG: 4-hydroxy-tetrahydrodipicolinate reductase [Verrucomicrobia bacterium]|nr:4-hydroxy-tetrahydrodipicolinate reductase [Verrucomicrobiota bacterium]
MIKIIVNGCKGRMGRAICDCAKTNDKLEVIGEVDIGDDIQPLIREADVVIDFSHHEATADIAGRCSDNNTALVIGTTGHNEDEAAAIRSFAESVPMVWTSNFSTGVNTLFWLTRKAAAVLDDEFDIEIVEMHHRLKKDAPSGTALSLARIASEARTLDLDNAARHGRKGMTGERTREEIGVHSIRGGDVVGDHTVIFAANGERIELTHKASSRNTFANGALRAAEWVANRKPGIYTMLDVLDLR